MTVTAAPELSALLQTFFGYGEFRPHQEEAVRAALEGRDVLVVMPAGAGKSLCFQLPAALSVKSGLVSAGLNGNHRVGDMGQVGARYVAAGSESAWRCRRIALPICSDRGAF